MGGNGGFLMLSGSLWIFNDDDEEGRVIIVGEFTGLSPSDENIGSDGLTQYFHKFLTPLFYLKFELQLN